jgi:hypothetical protein
MTAQRLRTTRVGELVGQRAVEAAARGIRPRASRAVDAAQVVRAAVDPARVAVGDQVGDRGRVDASASRQVPAREREDAGLERVEHRQQQVDVA